MGRAHSRPYPEPQSCRGDSSVYHSSDPNKRQRGCAGAARIGRGEQWPRIWNASGRGTCAGDRPQPGAAGTLRGLRRATAGMERANQPARPGGGAGPMVPPPARRTDDHRGAARHTGRYHDGPGGARRRQWRGTARNSTAIAFPAWQVSLLEATGKRATFLELATAELELGNVQVLKGRAEDLAHEGDYREAFDLCVARAVTNAAGLVELTLPFVAVGGSVILYKSLAGLGDELQAAETARVLWGPVPIGGTAQRRPGWPVPGPLSEAQPHPQPVAPRHRPPGAPPAHPGRRGSHRRRAGRGPRASRGTQGPASAQPSTSLRPLSAPAHNLQARATRPRNARRARCRFCYADRNGSRAGDPFPSGWWESHGSHTHRYAP